MSFSGHTQAQWLRILRRWLTVVICLAAVVSYAAACGKPAPQAAAASTVTKTFADARQGFSFLYLSPTLSAFGGSSIAKSAAAGLATELASTGAQCVAIANDAHSTPHVVLIVAVTVALPNIQSQSAAQVESAMPVMAQMLVTRFATGFGVAASTITAAPDLVHGVPSILMQVHAPPASLEAKSLSMRFLYTRARSYMLLSLTGKAADASESDALAASAASFRTTW